MQTQAHNYNGRKIVYRTKGEGPLVVLLHGFGEDGSVWKGQENLFPHHRLIIPDLPGSGGSEAVEDMSMEGLAEVIRAILATSIPQGVGGKQQGKKNKRGDESSPAQAREASIAFSAG